MKAIYSCKLYKSSTRKEKIQAALEDPINLELVTQLAKYLDEEYQTPELLGESSESDLESDSESDTSSGIQTSHRSAISSPGSSGGYSSPMSSDIDDIDLETPDDSESGEDFDSGDDELFTDDVNDVDNIPDDSEPSEEIEESTEIIDDGVLVASADTLSQDTIQEVKNALNENEETSGVNRIIIKENEVWIHYDDSINLNNVMGAVIELINASGYTYLEFNRLARSVNAVVFELRSTNGGE